MKRIVVDQSARVAEWVADKMGCNKWKGDDFSAIGIEKDGELVGGVVIDSFVKNARCAIHCSGEGRYWLSREFMRAVFDYVFNQLGCKVVVNPVSSNNEASLRFTQHIGFTEACRIEDGCSDGDLVIFKMPRSQCRWLGDAT